MPARFESRPLLARRAFSATLHGTVLLDVRSQLAFSLHLLSIIAASVIARNVANQEVLDAVGPHSLGSLYLAVALLSGALLAGFGWLSRGHDVRSVTIVTHLAASSLMLLAAVVPPSFARAALAKYVLIEIAAAAMLLGFGRLLGSRLAPREARKLAPKVGAGGIVGGLVAGGVLSFGAPLVGSRWLFLVAAVVALVPLAWLVGIAGGDRLARPLATPGESGSRKLGAYGRALALMAFVMVATTTLVEYLFRVGAKSLYTADRLTSFFGQVVLATGVMALLFQLGVLDRLLERLGLFATAAVTPAALALASAAFGVAPAAVVTLLVLKLVDSGTNMTVQQATSSLFLAPLGPRARSVWQSRIDGIARRGGQAAAGAFLAFYPWPPARVLPLTLALSVLWLVTIAVTRRRYVRLLVDMLRGGEAEEPSIRPQDRDTLRLLEAELEQATPARAAVILDLLAEAGQRASPAMLQRLAREGRGGAGALLAVDHLSKIGDAKALTPFATHVRADVSVNALVGVAKLDPLSGQRLARAVFVDERRPAPVRAAAAVLIADAEPGAVALVRLLTRTGDPETREALAFALAAVSAGPAALADAASALARDADDAVAVRALEALPRHASHEAIEVALAALERRKLRGPAMRSLAVIGSIAAERVAQELARDVDKPRVATSLAWVLGRLASPACVGALVEALWAQHAELRLAAAMALNSLKRRRPDVVLPLAATAARYRPEIEFYARMHAGTRIPLLPSGAGRLVRQLFKQRAQTSLECLFRLLALRYPEDALRGALLALSSGDRRQQQLALELLDSILDPDLRQALAHGVSASGRDKAADSVALLTHAVREEDAFLAALASRALVDLHAPVPARAAGPSEVNMSDPLIEDVLELQSVSLFGQSSAEDLAELATLLVNRRVCAGTTLFREGDAGEALYLIRSGRMTMMREGRAVDQLGPGDAFGVVAILDQKPRELTAVAASDCELRALAGDDLLQLLAERPLFMHSIFRALTQAIRGQLERVGLGKRSEVA